MNEDRLQAPIVSARGSSWSSMTSSSDSWSEWFKDIANPHRLGATSDALKVRANRLSSSGGQIDFSLVSYDALERAPALFASMATDAAVVKQVAQGLTRSVRCLLKWSGNSNVCHWRQTVDACRVLSVFSRCPVLLPQKDYLHMVDDHLGKASAVLHGSDAVNLPTPWLCESPQNPQNLHLGSASHVQYAAGCRWQVLGCEWLELVFELLRHRLDALTVAPQQVKRLQALVCARGASEAARSEALQELVERRFPSFPASSAAACKQAKYPDVPGHALDAFYDALSRWIHSQGRRVSAADLGRFYDAHSEFDAGFRGEWKPCRHCERDGRVHWVQDEGAPGAGWIELPADSSHSRTAHSAQSDQSTLSSKRKFEATVAEHVDKDGDPQGGLLKRPAGQKLEAVAMAEQDATFEAGGRSQGMASTRLHDLVLEDLRQSATGAVPMISTLAL